MGIIRTAPQSKDAITIRDSLHAYNAVIDTDKCVECTACHKVCQVGQKPDCHEPRLWIQGWADNEDIRKRSSSGGIATALMAAFIEEGGTVCSCTFAHGVFGFDFAESYDDLRRFVGSKYVKSNPSGIYKKIKTRLKNGEKILFIGLPCQVAAVKKYVGDKLAKCLYTVDLICHGSPSPKLLDMFLKEYYGKEGFKAVHEYLVNGMYKADLFSDL